MWNDAEPPFDLAEFLKAPPDEENAAPLYLDALFEFGSELSICYCLSGENPQGETMRRVEAAGQRYQEYARLEEARRKDPGSVDKTEVDAWLAQYDVGFQKLSAAQQRPRCVFQTGLNFDSLLPHSHVARQVARVVKWRTRRDLERGDFQRPIQDLETVLRLSRDLRFRGVEVSQLVSIAVDGISCQQLVPEILAARPSRPSIATACWRCWSNTSQGHRSFLGGQSGMVLHGPPDPPRPPTPHRQSCPAVHERKAGCQRGCELPDDMHRIAYSVRCHRFPIGSGEIRSPPWRFPAAGWSRRSDVAATSQSRSPAARCWPMTIMSRKWMP